MSSKTADGIFQLRKIAKFLVLVLLLILPWPGKTGAAPAAAAKLEPGVHSLRQFPHNDLNRSYSLYLPKGFSPEQSYPLVLALHGGGGSAEKWPVYTNHCFEHLADRDGFILVYPEGIEGHWNDGRGVKSIRAQREKIDDLGFLSTLIDHLAKTYPLDRSRIYVLGASNGGMMAHYLAASHADQIAAIAPIIASIPENLVGKLLPSDSVSVLMINGTDDPLVPWQGGVIKLGRREHGRVISVEQTVDFWVRAIQADAAPVVAELPALASNDETRVSRSVYGGGVGGSEVVLYTIKGGGHTWPAREDRRGGLRRFVVDKVVGRKSRQLDGCKIIWDFFQHHPKPTNANATGGL